MGFEAPVKTVDFRKLAAERGTTVSAVKASIRRDLKAGLIWSLLNPDLLNPGELFPYISIDTPPSSPAALVPFPVARDKLMAQDFLELEFLAAEKIAWCYRGQRGIGKKLERYITHLMVYYESAPLMGKDYCWYYPEAESCPYLQLLSLLLPAFANFTLDNPSPPQPSPEMGEAWHTPAADDFNARFQFSATQDTEEIVLAMALTGEKSVYCLKNYRLSLDRYRFLRQQLFYLLEDRLEPWRPETGKTNSFRGRIYKKPPSAFKT